MSLFAEQQLFKQRCFARAYQDNFLTQSIEQDLVERALTQLSHRSSLLIHGCRTKKLAAAFTDHNIEFYHPFHDSSCWPSWDIPITNKYGPHSFDIIIDTLTLHAVNDIKSVLQTYRMLLKPKGIFLAAFYGGETLRELRESLLYTEIALTGGAAARVIPMIDLQTALQLMQHCHFINPIVDKEINTISYKSILPLLHDIKKIGEHNPFITKSPPLTRSLLQKADDYYKKHYSDQETMNVCCTVEIIYMKGEND